MLLLVIVVFTSCSSDDAPKNNPPELSNNSMDVYEKLTSDLLTTIVAQDADEDELTYTIVSQTPSNSVIINETNGELYVGNASAFDYEQNTQIVVVISVSDGTTSTEATLTINILDVNENG